LAAPYPKHLESTGAARDGTPISLRPVRPDDEKLLQDLLAHMTRDDVRMRFFAPLRELSHALAERLLHIDYDRQMALVAEHDGTPLGVARYAADPDRLHAEFAVAVRSDWKSRGVGTLLMTRLVEVAARPASSWSARCCTRTGRCSICAARSASPSRRTRAMRR
jgi:acetyltransferase